MVGVGVSASEADNALGLDVVVRVDASQAPQGGPRVEVLDGSRGGPDLPVAGVLLVGLGRAVPVDLPACQRRDWNSR